MRKMENDRPDKKKNSEESDDTLYITATDQPPGEITIKLEADRKRKITIISECEPVEKHQRSQSQSNTPRRRRTSDDLRRQTLVNNAIRSQSESQSRSRSRSKSRGRSLTRTRSRSGDKLIKSRQSRSRSRSKSRKGRSKSRGRSHTRDVAIPAPKEVQKQEVKQEVKQETEHKPEFRLPTHLCTKNVIGSLAKKTNPEFLQLPAPLYILTEQQVVGASEKKTVQFVTKILLTSKKLTMDERKKLYAEMVEAEYVGTSRSTTDLIEDEPEEEFQCKIYYSDKGVYIHTVQNVKKLREGKCANVSEHKNYSKICKTRVVGSKGKIVEGTLNVSCQESFTVENQKYTRAENFKIGLKGANVNGSVLISSFKSTFDPTKTTHFDEIIKFDKENIGILVMHKASADMTKMWSHEMGSFGEEQCEYREIQFYFDEATPITPPPKTRMAITNLELKDAPKDAPKTVPKPAPKALPSAPSTASNSSASMSTASSSNNSLSSLTSAPMGSLSSASMSSASSNLISMNATNTEGPSINVTDGIHSDPPTSGSVTPRRTLTEAERSARSTRRQRSRAKRHKQRKRASSAASNNSSGSTSATGPKKQKSLDRCSSRKDRKDDAPLVFTKAPEMNSTLNNDTFIQTLPQATSTPKSPAKTNTSVLRSNAKSPRTPTIRDRSTTRLEEVDAKGSDNEVDLDKSLNTKKPAAKNLSLVLEGEQKKSTALTSTSLHSDRLSSHSGKSVASPKGTLRVKETKVTREVREEKGKPAEISEKKEETVKEEKVKLRGRSQSPSLTSKFLQLSAHEATHQTVHITPIKVDVVPAASSVAANSRHHPETVQIQMLIDKKHFNLNMNFDIIADKRPDVEVLGFSFAGKKLWEKSTDWPLSSANTTSQTKTIAVQASSILETDEKK